MLTIWSGYYAQAEHLNESPQAEGDILLSPLNAYTNTQIYTRTHTHTQTRTNLNMQAVL